MPRKPKAKWTPNPECQAAYGRVIKTAHIAAATLFGEKPAENPEENASSRAFLMAAGMIYFLLRIDPKDARALFVGEGSFGSLNYKPYPPGHWLRNGPFA